ncbi:nitroreductase family protein [Peribacillus asahii]|nr:nitroreductase family protein [Peribacillus asahii]USK83748.1 nitroreductase family protein [Peribacillus asahii]
MNIESNLTVEEVIRSRRTIKKFKKDPISLDTLKE